MDNQHLPYGILETFIASPRLEYESSDTSHVLVIHNNFIVGNCEHNSHAQRTLEFCSKSISQGNDNSLALILLFMG